MFKAQLEICFMGSSNLPREWSPGRPRPGDAATGAVRLELCHCQGGRGRPPLHEHHGVLAATSSAFLIANISLSNPRSLVDSSAFAPSDFASLGLSWTSMNTPSTPAATAARASTGMNSGCPPLAAGPLPSDCDDGSCTEC